MIIEIQPSVLMDEEFLVYGGVVCIKIAILGWFTIFSSDFFGDEDFRWLIRNESPDGMETMYGGLKRSGEPH